MSGKIDFRRVADAALRSADVLVAEWLPQGKRDGREWKALNPTRVDSRLGSFSINLDSGAWADFATNDAGGDLIALYAYLNGVEQLDAARAIAERLGIRGGAASAGDEAARGKRTDWAPVLPAPADAPEPPKAHLKRGRPHSSWRYLDAAGKLLGIVYRFTTSDGGKEVLPCCFAEHRVTHAREWRWMAFPERRPLYGLAGLAQRPEAQVLVVEGEKCADAARELLRGAPVAVTWPGGSKAVDKADWTPLRGRRVILWPDCDAQVDKAGQVLPEAQQPGMRAMERVAVILTELGCEVRIVAIPAPGAKPSGWDVADAIAEGWTSEQLRAFIKDHLRLPGAADRDARASSSAEQSVDQWAETRSSRLIWQGKSLKDCRENLIYVLRDHPAWRDALGADTFAKRIVARRTTPLGHQPGDEWTARAATELGLWLTEQVGLQMRSLDTIGDGVAYVAGANAFHPVREYLDALRWDGVPRLDTWAIHYLSAPDSAYVRAVSRFFLLNLVRRIYEPGCMMRSVVVLEGPQDRGKSTALRMLAQPWFADTPFALANKDVYQLIQGVLIYEISELDSFSRAEAAAVKAFVSSTEDNFRAPYERQNEKHKRQTVFAATTNAAEYLKDWTGNTRFWPLPTGETIDFDGLGGVRGQLFAEAIELYRAGARTYPTREEQQALFKPEQDQRLMAHPWLDSIADWADNEGRYKRDITVRYVMTDVLKIDLARINPQGAEAQRVGQILHALGFEKHRASDASRRWVWKRQDPTPQTDDEADAIPF